MADGSDARAKVGEESAEENKYDPRLDFFSELFDPLLALKTPGIVPPCVDAKEHDNLAMYESCWSKEASQRQKKAVGTNESDTVNERKWLPHQLPIKREIIPKNRNVLKYMESVEGPLVLLKKCKDEKLKLKIWMRHSHGIRGYCTGYVLAFDKHWNMALEDVNEVWTRPKRRKVPPLDNANLSSVSKSRRVKLPEMVVTTCENKKLERCERYVKYLLVRGEQIAFVVVLSGNEEKTKEAETL